MRPITVNLGPNVTGGTSSNLIRLDEWADAPLGVQVSVVSGSVNFTVQHSFDEGPDSLFNPIAQASMYWGTDLIASGAVGGTASISFSMATAPIWIRILMNSGTGALRMVVSQYNVVEV